MEWAKPSTIIVVTGLLMLAPATVSTNKRPSGFSVANRPLIISCMPLPKGSRKNKYADGKQMPIFPGWGHYHFGISSRSDSAGNFFDQGLSLYYSYHSPEAIESFREAAWLDTGSAISYWGQALALGPSYNSPDYEMPAEIPALLNKLIAQKKNASAKEQDMIATMQERYSAKGDAGRRKLLNRSYSEAMRKLISKYPADLDIKALYVDAVMLEHAWDFWYNDGRPKEWTVELISLCEEVLHASPNHPGAMHYYIHLTEASRQPQLALENAKRLRATMPGVAHMVHMSSHVYERTGQFGEGVAVNDLADQDLKQYDSLARNLSLPTSSSHYYAVQAFCAMNGGMLNKGLPAFLRCRESVNPSRGNYYAQYLFMFPVLAWVRLGQWQSILKSPKPESDWTYALILDDFAKGIAMIRTQHIDSAKYYLHHIDPLLLDSSLTARNIPFSAPIQSARIARDILAAEISSSENNPNAASGYYERAIRSEDSLIYQEPKSWVIPTRQFYGASLLKWKMPEQAENIYREDLIWNPGNGWSLLGLYQCRKAQHQPRGAELYRKKYTLAFHSSDLLITGSVF